MRQFGSVPAPFGGGEFAFWRASDLAQDTSQIGDERAGVYAFFLRGGARLLEVSGYYALNGEPPISIDGHFHLYTGLAFGLGRRLKNHLHGDTRTSTLRKSLLAIDLYCCRPDQAIIGCKDAYDEGPLSDWLHNNALVAIRPANDPVLAEQILLTTTASPLNITTRRESTYARRLIALRCALDNKPIPQCCLSTIEQWLTQEPHT